MPDRTRRRSGPHPKRDSADPLPPQAVASDAGDAMFRSVFEHSPVGIALVGLDGHVLRANAALQRMLGYSEGELNQLSFTEFTHPDDAAADSSLFGEMLEGIRDGYHLDKRFIHRDGHVVWARLSVSVLRDAAGKPATVIGMAVDVTAEREARHERSRVLAELRERVKEATALHQVARLVQDESLSTDDLLERVATILPPAFQFPEQSGGFVRYGIAYARSAHYRNDAPQRLFANFSTRDGRSGRVEVSLLADAVPTGRLAFLPEEQKLLDAIAEMLKVAFERRASDSALQRSEERLRHTLSAASVGIWEWDLRSDAVSWSEELERIAGLAPGSFGGTLGAYSALVHPDDLEPVRASIYRAVQDPASSDRFESEFRMRQPDGSYRWCVSRGRVVRDAAGNAVRMLGMAHDITSMRDLQRQLEQSQKLEALGRLAGGVAHDFNNLLTAVKGYAEFVIDALPSSDPAAADVREISTAADRAAALTRQLLAFSRTKVLDRQVVRVAETVRSMEKLIKRLIGGHIEVTVRIAAPDALVRIDPGQLEQVIMNLAVNARDAMPDGGTLTVELTRTRFDERVTLEGFDAASGDYAMLSISDTGVGMSPEVRVRIFEPFFTTKEVGRGTGIGLATVHGIVQQGGGAIFVYSEPGEGTSFRVHLPLVPDAEAPRATALPTGTALRGTETVLLVDDDPAVRLLAERALAAAGYTVHAFADAREAQAAARRVDVSPDMLITDVVMPQLQGPELAAAVRHYFPKVRVLYMTGFSDREIEPGGAPAVLQKPFAPSGLLRAVRALLDAN